MFSCSLSMQLPTNRKSHLGYAIILTVVTELKVCPRSSAVSLALNFKKVPIF